MYILILTGVKYGFNITVINLQCDNILQSAPSQTVQHFIRPALRLDKTAMARL
jgi:hypothetical protein